MSIRPGIDLLCCSCVDLPRLAGRADLVIADPPWRYEQAFGEGTAADHYAGLPIAVIRNHLEMFHGARLALWITFPILPEWSTPTGWKQVTGAAWVKSGPGDTGHYGPGYHLAGCAEPVLIYTGRWNTGPAFNSRAKLRGAWIEAPNEHSRKPVAWQKQWIERWVPPGGLVVDPYAGLGSVCEATILAGEGRRYLGAELDPVRHARAVELCQAVP